MGNTERTGTPFPADEIHEFFCCKAKGIEIWDKAISPIAVLEKKNNNNKKKLVTTSVDELTRCYLIMSDPTPEINPTNPGKPARDDKGALNLT